MSKRIYQISGGLLLLMIACIVTFTDILPISFLPASDLDGIKKRGKLTLVTAFNPTGYFLYKDEPMGFEYDFIKKFAESIHVDLEVIEVNSPDEMYEKLLTGEADIMAYNIPVMNLPMQFAIFSDPYIQTELVLVQRKIEKKSPQYIDQVSDLAGKNITITEQSPYIQTLSDIKFDLNNTLHINTLDNTQTPEDLIRMVAESEIEYTVANKEIALINKEYYKNLDINTPLTAPQDIAFTVHRKHRKLLRALNHFISASRKNQVLYALYNKYFKTSRLIASADADDDDLLPGLSTEAISGYDGLIQKYAGDINWDWRLVAAMIWQESKFKPAAKSWAGATGLMQLMPATARRFGLNSMQEIYHPELNIKTGTKYIAWLEDFWKEIEDETERKKFIMASYNAGEGHVKDAQRLTKKYGYNPEKWDGNVEYFLLNKSKPAFYRDPVCKYGYCRGAEPFHYVRSIIKRYSHYKGKYSSEHTAGYNFSLDFTPAYEFGLDNSSDAPTVTRRQLFESNEVFRERSLLKKDTGIYRNNLVPRNQERIQLKNDAQPTNQLFKKNELFRK